MSVRVSFVTSLYGCLPLTQAMLASLWATVADWSDKQIVLIDDASPDRTADFLQTLAADPRCVVLHNSTNLGFAASNNRAAAAAQGDILVFLNNDLVLLPGWLDPLLELLASLPDAGAVGNVQRSVATGLVDHAGIFFDLEGMPTHAHKNRAAPPPGPSRERNAATAACLAIPRQLFLQHGGFDVAYRNGCEDVDLCVRLRQAGRRIYVSHRSVILHHVSSSPGRNLHNDANSQLFRSRWASYTRSFGQIEWPAEYLRRYARHWWKIQPSKAYLALSLLCRRAFAKNAF